MSAKHLFGDSSSSESSDESSSGEEQVVQQQVSARVRSHLQSAHYLECFALRRMVAMWWNLGSSRLLAAVEV